jgi:hypothetical protein
VGRHSRKGPVPKGSESGSRSDSTPGIPGGEWEAVGASPGGRRRRGVAEPAPEQHAPTGYGAPQARGGHPEQHETGGGWGSPQGYENWQGAPRAQTAVQQSPRTVAGGARIPGPRREFVEAFDQPQPQSQRMPESDPYAAGPYASGSDWDDDPDRAAQAGPEADAPEEPPAKVSKGRAFTGIAAAAVTTVLAVVVAGQVATDGPEKTGAQSAGEGRGAERSPASRSDQRAAPAQPEAGQKAVRPAYEQLMATQFPIDPKLKGSGDFESVPGFDRAPGKGRKIRYRVDVETGLGLDGELFAKAVQSTLNDDRSWAHGGAMTFERISSGEPEFVITLASPGTTATWCAKSGLDTTVDNVSCDSASTERVMINAYRWAQGSETYGDKAMLSYRQMLINHEVGHRLGFGHVTCRTPGALAPVMQQQTKSLDIDGITCRPNPWAHPGS